MEQHSESAHRESQSNPPREINDTIVGSGVGPVAAERLKIAHELEKTHISDMAGCPSS